jgi:hypothetical protein
MQQTSMDGSCSCHCRAVQNPTANWLPLLLNSAVCVAVQVSNFRGHSDYIRSAALSPASEDVWATSG